MNGVYNLYDSLEILNIYKLQVLLHIPYSCSESRIVSTFAPACPASFAAECRSPILANSTGFFSAANIRAGSSIVRMSRERLARE